MARAALLLEELLKRAKEENLPPWVIEKLTELYKKSYKEGYKDCEEDLRENE